jgi:hypothetical protein
MTWPFSMHRPAVAASWRSPLSSAALARVPLPGWSLSGQPGQASKSRRKAGFSLIMVLVVVGAAFLTLAGVLLWNSESSRMSQRHNELYTSQAAAEAATEKVIAQLSRDFQAGGAALVAANEASYTALAPSSAENPAWANYDFTSPGGVPVYVSRASNWTWGALNWKYSGMMTSNAVYRVIANARDVGGVNNVTAAVLQDVQLASIPLFSYFAFYNLDLEFGMSTGNWNINGPVHCNANCYLHPKTVPLTFFDNFTASGFISLDKHPDNCYSSGPYSSVTFRRTRDSHVNALRLETGMTAANIITNYYNLAQCAIEVQAGGGVVITSPSLGGIGLAWPAFTNVINTTNRFRDTREFLGSGKDIEVTEFDVGTFIANHPTPGGQAPSILYIADYRPETAAYKHAVRIKNCQFLPVGGLTIATPNPLYVKGRFNVDNSQLGTTNTSLSKPASLVADAVTLLSRNWADFNSYSTLAGRLALPTTFNAAILTGIVPTSPGNGADCYSGGIENTLRLLEDWNYGGGQQLTFNGSLAVVFPSQVADQPWHRSGTFGGNVYRPPPWLFRFDQNFSDPAKLPPATPYLRTLIRSDWKLIAPGSIP